MTIRELPITKERIEYILSLFQVEAEEVTAFVDSSRGEEDIRWNLIFGENYVLKINTPNGMWEDRLQEISRLIDRYRSIGIYCPAYIPTKNGELSFVWEYESKKYTCFIEEFAIHPAYGWEMPHDRKSVVEHLGLLAARYTGVDLSETRSMWSIIDLAPFDTEIDEKQENCDMLVTALQEAGFCKLADRVNVLNQKLRATIMPEFRALPRCVFQGDLNSSNELHDNGCFVGLIDFNCSGTDVNINVFINETNWFPEEAEFDTLSIADILEKMDRVHADESSPIYKHYSLNELEQKLYPYFKRIVDLFQYPDVCDMMKWLKDETRREKCAQLIEALVDKPITIK